MARLKRRAAPHVNSNFGLLDGGWIRLIMPELGLDQELVGYASDTVMKAAQASNVDFAGLPLLRLVEYGGDANWFWIRPGAAKP